MVCHEYTVNKKKISLFLRNLPWVCCAVVLLKKFYKNKEYQRHHFFHSSHLFSLIYFKHLISRNVLCPQPLH